MKSSFEMKLESGWRYPNGDHPEGLIIEQEGPRVNGHARAYDLLIQRDASVYLF